MKKGHFGLLSALLVLSIFGMGVTAIAEIASSGKMRPSCRCRE
jgi:hypothetical protein